MHRHRISDRLLLSLALAGLLSLGGAAAPELGGVAGAKTAHANSSGPATNAVKQANTTISELLKKKAPGGSAQEKALSAKVTSSVRGFLDIDALGKSALSKHWDGLPKAQRTEFLGLLRSLIEAKYVDGLRANLDYSVSYTGEASQKGGKRLVRTEITATRRGRPHKIAVDYLVTGSGKRWQAVDVITDGVGLVENYRAQFNSIIAKKGFDGLLGLMRKRQGAAAK